MAASQASCSSRCCCCCCSLSAFFSASHKKVETFAQRRRRPPSITDHNEAAQRTGTDSWTALRTEAQTFGRPNSNNSNNNNSNIYDLLSKRGSQTCERIITSACWNAPLKQPPSSGNWLRSTLFFPTPPPCGCTQYTHPETFSHCQRRVWDISKLSQWLLFLWPHRRPHLHVHKREKEREGETIYRIYA